MYDEKRKTGRKTFTTIEKKLLCGLTQKVAEKHGCIGMYVWYILHGHRNTYSLLARSIVEDLKALLILLRSGT